MNQFKRKNIFKENINIKLNLSEVYLDNDNIVKKLNGKLGIVDNKISQANISALFSNNENLTFTINTKDNEKITTLFSSYPKPLVKQYKFIKGFEEGNRDELISRLALLDIGVNVHYIPLPMLSYFKSIGLDIFDYPTSFDLYKNEVSLPIYNNLSLESVEYVCLKLVKIVNEINEINEY